MERTTMKLKVQFDSEIRFEQPIGYGAMSRVRLSPGIRGSVAGAGDGRTSEANQLPIARSNVGGFYPAAGITCGSSPACKARRTKPGTS
jgi:hypothetical protein